MPALSRRCARRTAYDTGVEFDASEGNVRCFRNRFTNTYATISFQPIFESGLVAPASYQTPLSPADVRLADGTNAIDHGLVLPGIDEDYAGSAPDLGAVEHGCAMPLYGVRPPGVDETTAATGCPTTGTEDGGMNQGKGGSGGVSGTSASANDAAASANPDASRPTSHANSSAGCGCRAARSPSGSWWSMAVATIALAAGRPRRRSASKRRTNRPATYPGLRSTLSVWAPNTTRRRRGSSGRNIPRIRGKNTM